VIIVGPGKDFRRMRRLPIQVRASRLASEVADHDTQVA
jgi:hypothetical protein